MGEPTAAATLPVMKFGAWLAVLLVGGLSLSIAVMRIIESRQKTRWKQAFKEHVEALRERRVPLTIAQLNEAAPAPPEDANGATALARAAALPAAADYRADARAPASLDDVLWGGLVVQVVCWEAVVVCKVV